MATSPSSKNSILQKFYKFFCSFGLATVLLTLLLLITFFGTLEQVEHGLYESQKKYFESMLITDIDLGEYKIPVIAPGGFLVMSLLFINILMGAIVKILKNPRNIGLMVTHVSMLVLLASGFVSYFFKKDGSMALFEGQTSNEFNSYHDSVIEIEKLPGGNPEKARKALVIPGKHYQDLSEGKARTFHHESLPFDLQIMNYTVNGEPRKADSGMATQADGYYIQPLQKKEESELNLDAAYVKVINKKDQSSELGILYRGNAAPFTFKVGEDVFSINLGRRTWTLPFSVRLEKFEREVHPGTERARSFTSHVTWLKDGVEEKRDISMNAPLRDSGHILFQASFSQERASNGGQINRSVFAVVENPSDQWPLYATIAVSIGLLIHMAGQLNRFLARSKKETPKS